MQQHQGHIHWHKKTRVFLTFQVFVGQLLGNLPLISATTKTESKNVSPKWFFFLTPPVFHFSTGFFCQCKRSLPSRRFYSDFWSCGICDLPNTLQVRSNVKSRLCTTCTKNLNEIQASSRMCFSCQKTQKVMGISGSLKGTLRKRSVLFIFIFANVNGPIMCYINLSPLSAMTLLAGFMMAESAEMGRLIGLAESLRSMITTWAWSPTFSRTQMNLSDSMVRVLNPMLAALMPRFWSCRMK